MSMHIADGRAYFYQWDIDREMIVDDPAITELHFCNGRSDCSLVCKVKNGKAPVPNILLRTAANIRIYGYIDDHTGTVKVFRVMPRTKPEDYVYTETEVLTWRSLDGRISALEQTQGGNVTPAQIQQAVDIYLAANPIQENDPTVPDWAKQPGKPTYTAQEVGALPADAEIVDNAARQGVAENTEAISQLSEEIEQLKGGETESEIVITPTADDVLDECFINQYGKTSVAATGYHCTDYISLGEFMQGKPVTANCTIVGNCSLAFYDESKNAILIVNKTNAADYGITPGIPMQEVTIIPPEGAKYIRFSANSGQAGANYDGPESLYLKGMVVVENVGSMSSLNHLANANLTNFYGFRVLVLGDSISTDYYGGYKKWVTDLIDIGFFDPDNTVNDSIHATGFVARYNNGANNFITRIEAVEDPETYDLVVVFGGINDYIQNIPMGESGGDKTTHFKPAVDYFFQYLVDNFTQARLAVLSPLHTHFAKIDNTEGHKEAEYADYIKEVAKSYCLPVLNLTDESGFCPFVKSFKALYTLTPDGYENPDGVHPTEEYSRKYLAPMIRHFLQGLM